jgi:hypothetical protein
MPIEIACPSTTYEQKSISNLSIVYLYNATRWNALLFTMATLATLSCITWSSISTWKVPLCIQPYHVKAYD